MTMTLNLTPARPATVTYLIAQIEVVAASKPSDQAYLIPAFCRVIAEFSFTRDQVREMAQAVHTITDPSAAAITMDLIDLIAL